VAEGVESDRQLRLLCDMGITYYQGYLRSPAVPVAELAAL
jgi:EAL domain-containing protein (putative c-di-GMP-specific phosphodiesterase class I)